MFYDVFFKIIKDRESRRVKACVNRGNKNQQERSAEPALRRTDDRPADLRETIEKFGDAPVGGMLNLVRGMTVDDFLYFPSTTTANRREEIIRKFGDQILKLDKDVSIPQHNK